jgi:regulator of cell morphogenesis and NO signaling
MDITPETRIGDIAAHHPLATRVFARHGIDFCCGGGAPLERACETKGLAAGEVLAEIRRVLDGPDAGSTDWLGAPLSDLVEHIVTTYHAPLREELPRLEAMARKVAKVHAERDPEGRLPALVATFVGLRGELEDHMAREEAVLFPAILQGMDGLPFQVFVDDHTEAGEALARLRELTEDYVAPEDACNTWRALWAGLADLESETHQHIHLENNVLFPRAERSVGGAV